MCTCCYYRKQNKLKHIHPHTACKEQIIDVYKKMRTVSCLGPRFVVLISFLLFSIWNGHITTSTKIYICRVAPKLLHGNILGWWFVVMVQFGRIAVLKSSSRNKRFFRTTNGAAELRNKQIVSFNKIFLNLCLNTVLIVTLKLCLLQGMLISTHSIFCLISKLSGYATHGFQKHVCINKRIQRN